MSYLDKVTVGGATYDIADSEARAGVDELKSAISNANDKTMDIGTALLACLQHVAWADAYGRIYYNALYDAVYQVLSISLNKSSMIISELAATEQLIATTVPAGGAVVWLSSDESVATVSQSGVVTAVSYGNATITATAGEYSAQCFVVVSTVSLTSIEAVYTPAETVYTLTALDHLKSDLVVTANWSDGSSEILSDTDYTLSGTLASGTSTITADFGGKTDTFDVTVIALTAYDYVAIKSDVTINQTTAIMVETNLVPGCSIESEFVYTDSSQSNAVAIMGIRRGMGGSSIRELAVFVTPSTGKMGYWYANTDTTNNYSPFSANTKNVIKILPVGKSETYPLNAVIVVNGTEYNTGATSTSFVLDSWFGFFRYAISATEFGPTTNVPYIGAQIGRTVMKDSAGQTINDFIPASDGTNCGMYDAIENVFNYDSSHSSAYECGNWS